MKDAREHHFDLLFDNLHLQRSEIFYNKKGTVERVKGQEKHKSTAFAQKLSNKLQVLGGL